MKQLMSLAATFSRTANSFRIARPVPVSAPKLGIIGTSVLPAGALATMRMTE